MGTFSKNADGLVQHYGARDATGEHKLDNEREVSNLCIFDDFLYSGVFEASSPWILHAGTDAQAIDPAIVAGVTNGVVRLTAGNNSGTYAEDASQLVGQTGMYINNGGLFMEAKIKCVTNTDTMSINVGFTDSGAREEPFSVSGTTVTSTATDGVCFTYDTAATTDQWYCLGVDTNTDATGNGLSGVAPSTSYQTLRIEIGADGNTAKFFINGAKVGELTGSVSAASTALFPTITVNSTTTTSKSVDVDYISCGTLRV